MQNKNTSYTRGKYKEKEKKDIKSLSLIEFLKHAKLTTSHPKTQQQIADWKETIDKLIQDLENDKTI